MAHTPLPWEVLDVLQDGEISQYWIGFCGLPCPVICTIQAFDQIAKQPIPQALDNANLIVRAVNHHAKLVEALQAIANDCENWLNEDEDEDEIGGMDPGDLMAAFRDTADALLAEINGKHDDSK